MLFAGATLWPIIYVTEGPVIAKIDVVAKFRKVPKVDEVAVDESGDTQKQLRNIKETGDIYGKPLIVFQRQMPLHNGESGHFMHSGSFPLYTITLGFAV